jgi:hypothetical protein
LERATEAVELGRHQKVGALPLVGQTTPQMRSAT